MQAALYIVADIVDTSSNANKIQLIDKETLKVVETLTVAAHTLKKMKTISMEVAAGVSTEIFKRVKQPVRAFSQTV